LDYFTSVSLASAMAAPEPPSSPTGGNPYASFVRLPGKLSPGGSAVGTGLSAELVNQIRSAASGSSTRASRGRPRAFVLADSVLQNQETWLEDQKSKDASQAERKELMKVALSASPTPTRVGEARPAASGSAASASTPKAKAQPTPAPPKTEYTPPGLHDEATFEFAMPDSRYSKERLNLNSSPFDLRCKVYSLLANKDREFFMTLKGPRGVSSPWSKEITEDTWSETLASLGIKAGCTYDVTVKQP